MNAPGGRFQIFIVKLNNHYNYYNDSEKRQFFQNALDEFRISTTELNSVIRKYWNFRPNQKMPVLADPDSEVITLNDNYTEMSNPISSQSRNFTVIEPRAADEAPMIRPILDISRLNHPSFLDGQEQPNFREISRENSPGLSPIMTPNSSPPW